MTRAPDDGTSHDAAPTTQGDQPVDPALPRPVQEHLARQLRAEYHRTEDKPAFLGDPAVPAAFDEHLHRLEAKEREIIGERGLEAVEAALLDPSGAIKVQED
jgi:hypothetical protein